MYMNTAGAAPIISQASRHTRCACGDVMSCALHPPCASYTAASKNDVASPLHVTLTHISS